VEVQEAERFLKDKNMTFMVETSSKSNENVEVAFREAVKQIIVHKINQ
jgi:hypothetical protein